MCRAHTEDRLLVPLSSDSFSSYYSHLSSRTLPRVVPCSLLDIARDCQLHRAPVGYIMRTTDRLHSVTAMCPLLRSLSPDVSDSLVEVTSLTISDDLVDLH